MVPLPSHLVVAEALSTEITLGPNCPGPGNNEVGGLKQHPKRVYSNVEAALYVQIHGGFAVGIII